MPLICQQFCTDLILLYRLYCCHWKGVSQDLYHNLYLLSRNRQSIWYICYQKTFLSLGNNTRSLLSVFKKEQRRPPSGSLHLLTYFKNFVSFHKMPLWSFQYISLLFWMEGQESGPRKTHFVIELMEVSRPLSTHILLRSSKYLSHTYENFATCIIKSFFSVSKALLTLDSWFLHIHVVCKKAKCYTTTTLVTYITLTHVTQYISYIYIYIFNCYLAAPRPTLGHSRGDSLTNPMLITAFFVHCNITIVALHLLTYIPQGVSSNQFGTKLGWPVFIPMMQTMSDCLTGRYYKILDLPVSDKCLYKSLWFSQHFLTNSVWSVVAVNY